MGMVDIQQAVVDKARMVVAAQVEESLFGSDDDEQMEVFGAEW